MSYTTIPVVGIDFTAIGSPSDFVAPTTIPQYAPGMKLQANDCTYQYIKAASAIAQYDLVKISNTFTAASATTTTNPSTEPAKCGAAQVAIAANAYGWVAVGPGLMTVNVAASCVQDVVLYTTATAGVVDDSATTRINGLKLIATITSAAASPCIAECELGTVLAAN